MSLVLTKAALALKNPDSNFQLVKYESHKPKKKTRLGNDDKIDSDVNTARKKELDLKKIRHDVVKFGMSGFDGAKKEEAKIALAVSLGAKPPKGQYVNYKELMASRKEQKAKLNEEKQLMISKSILSTRSKKKKVQNNDVGHLLSSYGKVQKKELKKKEGKSIGKKKRNK